MTTNAIAIRTGNEGPRHDPYGFTEITFACRAGVVVVHLGLAEWLKVDGVRVLDRDCDAAFERITGLSPGRAVDLFYSGPQRRHAAKCPERKRFQCVSGFPGEQFTLCLRCGDAVEYSFDRSAVE
jgi:hypothetical protein